MIVEDEQTREGARRRKDAPCVPDSRWRPQRIIEALADANERPEKRAQRWPVYAQGMPERNGGSAQGIDGSDLEPFAAFGAGHVSNMARAENRLIA